MQDVYVRLMGGLGNQLFQYATARALAISKGAEVKLDVTGYETDSLRCYELDSYPIRATIASDDEIAAIPSRRTGRLGNFRRAQAKLYQMLAGGKTQPCTTRYREPHFHFDRKLIEQTPPVLLEGYWQSERYFLDIADTLRLEITPREPAEPENSAIAADIESHVAVSVHVRRGDYVSNARTGAYHGVCPLDYYRASVEYIADRVADVHLFVFSDDPDWTRENLKSTVPTTYVAANSSHRGFRDLQLMRSCRHHIIANSSFSWWGAWLNPSPDKIVVAPAKWFAADDKDTRDLIPEQWVRL